MRYRDIIEGDIVHFPQPEIPAAIKSLADTLTDPRPIHQMYEVGDMLDLDGETGEVKSVNADTMLIAFPSGDRIVPRNASGLTVTPFEKW
jgi:hypothetical protein